jgi:hypothetical protein
MGRFAGDLKQNYYRLHDALLVLSKDEMVDVGGGPSTAFVQPACSALAAAVAAAAAKARSRSNTSSTTNTSTETSTDDLDTVD